MDYIVLAILAMIVFVVVRHLKKNKGACSGCSKTDCHLCEVNVYQEYMKDKKKSQDMC
ncbi:MAG: FeoB-associated Cys-rich membrane protein [Erysipelotrichaceae bacterium]|nr:FeoB-associated Cys-rich membrane protein [Erysipelotrichaceae bacterium]MDD3924161.1 FeoB-associated Cys-rich membrane protein [Erysipelotrichaceae bacterium]MDD4642402.1 FeoB-associated Cys-rich membrane protein [Erysipelotrichaceae bacterium]